MKIRFGFVSNSSVASFCVYGWDIEILRQAGRFDIIKKIIEETKVNIRKFYCDNDYVLGVGNYDGSVGVDIDDVDSGECFVDEPTTEEIAIVDNFAKEHNLPKPQFFQGTFYNG